MKRIKLHHPELLKGFLFVFLSAFIQILLLEDHYLEMINREPVNSPQTLFYLLTIVVICCFWFLSIHSFYKFSTFMNQEQIAKETERLQQEESQKLIWTLQTQRHDFRNQLQVIKVLAQFHKDREIADYIQDCNLALADSNSILEWVSAPVISATLLVFEAQAKKRNIGFNVDADLDFKEFDLAPAKISRILGNILQNALEVFDNSIAEEKAIQVTIWETAESYYFVIWNNGPAIPDADRERIFSPGFSTKNSTGLGLAIVKETVTGLGGRVTLASSPEMGTEFKLVFPKKKGAGSQVS